MEHSRKIIYFAGFFFSVPMALMIYINSSFLSSFISKELVGLTFAFGSIFSILALFAASRIFRKIGGYKFLLLVVAFDALSILACAISNNPWIISIAFIVGFALNTLIVFSLDELLKIFSKDSAIGRIRGIYLAVCHLAFILAQLASGTILGYFSFKEIYFIAFIVMALFFVFSFFRLKEIPDPKYDNMKTLQYLKEFFKNRNLLRAYIINFLLQFFYCWMVIYTPIYLYNNIGFSWKEIGIIFAIMLLPFILIPFHIGKYGDKVGERKMLMFGFTIVALSTLLLFFIESHIVWLWALLLFATRVGAATIEVMSDAYFFKHIKPESEEFVGVYRSVMPVAYIIGPLIASMFFIFTPSFNFIYLVLGALMLYGIYLSSTIKKGDV
jgi:MFS family permease